MTYFEQLAIWKDASDTFRAVRRAHLYGFISDEQFLAAKLRFDNASVDLDKAELLHTQTDLSKRR